MAVMAHATITHALAMVMARDSVATMTDTIMMIIILVRAILTQVIAGTQEPVTEIIVALIITIITVAAPSTPQLVRTIALAHHVALITTMIIIIHSMMIGFMFRRRGITIGIN